LVKRQAGIQTINNKWPLLYYVETDRRAGRKTGKQADRQIGGQTDR